MTMSINVKALGAFKKLGAVTLITATLAMCFTACKQTGGASLILSPNNLNISVRAVTEDGSAVTVEGCTETTLANNVETELHAKGTKVVLRGNITELFCGGNKLTSLNVQGCASLQKLTCWGNELTALDVSGLTALKELSCSDNKLTELNLQGLTALQKLDCNWNKLTSLNVQGLPALKGLGCWSNQLNAQAMTELLKGLPTREEGDKAEVVLYTEEKDYTEGNCTDFTQPAELKTALEGAKSRKWMLKKFTANEGGVDL